MLQVTATRWDSQCSIPVLCFWMLRTIPGLCPSQGLGRSSCSSTLSQVAARALRHARREPTQRLPRLCGVDRAPEVGTGAARDDRAEKRLTHVAARGRRAEAAVHALGPHSSRHRNGAWMAQHLDRFRDHEQVLRRLALRHLVRKRLAVIRAVKLHVFRWGAVWRAVRIAVGVRRQASHRHALSLSEAFRLWALALLRLAVRSPCARQLRLDGARNTAQSHG
mmetsp:Transcript_9506/g.24654  ORF Transcript_9506/g.24654 Transcript_9506/m.24654 type:complete len:222 (+) Transcript_9506:96-761(+)